MTNRTFRDDIADTDYVPLATVEEEEQLDEYGQGNFDCFVFFVFDISLLGISVSISFTIDDEITMREIHALRTPKSGAESAVIPSDLGLRFRDPEFGSAFRHYFSGQYALAVKLAGQLGNFAVLQLLNHELDEYLPGDVSKMKLFLVFFICFCVIFNHF